MKVYKNLLTDARRSCTGNLS